MGKVIYESCHWFVGLDLWEWGLPIGFSWNVCEGHMLLIFCLQIVYIPYGTYLPKTEQE